MNTNDSYTNIEDLEDIEGLGNFDITTLRPASSKSFPRESTNAGVISIVNSKDGKRISLSKGLLQKLNNPKTIQFSFFDNGIAIAESLPNNDITFVIKDTKNQFLVYSAPIVNEITEMFSLDFEGITSKTFHEVKYLTNSETPVALITIQ
jgi:hypothetical protein